MIGKFKGFKESVRLILQNRFGYVTSVTRLGDILDFGQLFKAFGNNYLAPIFPFLGNFCKGVKIIHFSIETIFGQLLQKFGNFYLVTLAVTNPMGALSPHSIDD